MKDAKYFLKSESAGYKRHLEKMLSVFVLLRHRGIKKEYRYYLRNNYFARLYQLRFFWKDYVRKSRYKEISYQGEFSARTDFRLALCLLAPLQWHTQIYGLFQLH